MDGSPILIVDDEQSLLDLISLILRRVSRPVLTAKDGFAALKLLEQHQPALVMLDIAMPGMTGLEVLRHIRSQPTLESTKIIILSAVPNQIGKEDRALVDMVLAKPTTPKILEEAVRQLLGELDDQ